MRKKKLINPQKEMSVARFVAERGCEHVFFDVGANIGVQVRKLAEPRKYAGAPLLERFRALFGPPPWCRVCTIAFEPNPVHAKRLDVLEARLRAARAPPLHVFRAAAGVADGRVPFLQVGHQGDGSTHARTRRLRLAASVATGGGAWRNGSSTLVPLVDLARVVHAAAAALRGGRNRSSEEARSRRMMMKLDVEGSEVGVLLHLVRSQALCLLDRVEVEWHDAVPHWLRSSMEDGDVRLLASVTTGVRSVLQAGLPLGGCRTQLLTFDDETFYKDGRAWPTAPICAW